VARSWNFYPSGAASPGEGALSLALGLGKTIVDGGRAWTCSPAHPRAAPPVAGIEELLDTTQRDFWAVNMGRAPAYDPTREEEYLVRCDLAEAESDGVLRGLASTYDPGSDRLSPGTGAAGVRVLNFAPVLLHEEPPVAEAVTALLKAFEEATEGPVEIEFAVNVHDAALPRLGFLQVRPMAVAREAVDLAPGELGGPGALVSCERALGNGTIAGIRDVVYVRPALFEARHTRTIAAEIAAANRRLLQQGRPYLLIGFGRWGSSDPWLGIPVAWGDVAGARVIVEATLPAMNVELSQGAHFFHNLISFGVPYLCVAHSAGAAIDWAWLDAQPAVEQAEFVRHVRLPRPLAVKVDGRSGRGVVRKGEV
jgi:Pyruvate phosphate dikinase, AMP/ATP-binding domain